MHVHSSQRPAVSQSARRPDVTREPGEVWSDFLHANRRSSLNRVRHLLGELADLGFRVESMGPGYRMVPTRPAMTGGVR